MAASLLGHCASVHGRFLAIVESAKVIQLRRRRLAQPYSPPRQQLFTSARRGHHILSLSVAASRQPPKPQASGNSAQAARPDSQQENAAPKERAQLYPLSDVISEGYMPASSGHSIYYQVRGNPDGYPALCVHGGPGAGAYPKHSCFFDPAFYRIILFDQRGCGRSLPKGSLVDNTTWHLVDDMERLRVLLGVERWLLFGGSWGVTLSLAYAQAHPARVAGAVLRGVCLMRRQDLEWFAGNERGDPAGAAQLLPFSYARFSAGFTPGGRHAAGAPATTIAAAGRPDSAAAGAAVAGAASPSTSSGTTVHAQGCHLAHEAATPSDGALSNGAAAGHVQNSRDPSLAELYYERLTGDNLTVAEAAARQWFGWEMALSSAGTTPPGLVYLWDGEQYLSKDTVRNTVTDARGTVTTPKPAGFVLRRPNRASTSPSSSATNSQAAAVQSAASPGPAQPSSNASASKEGTSSSAAAHNDGNRPGMAQQSVSPRPAQPILDVKQENSTSGQSLISDGNRLEAPFGASASSLSAVSASPSGHRDLASSPARAATDGSAVASAPLGARGDATTRVSGTNNTRAGQADTPAIGRNAGGNLRHDSAGSSVQTSADRQGSSGGNTSASGRGGTTAAAAVPAASTTTSTAAGTTSSDSGKNLRADAASGGNTNEPTGGNTAMSSMPRLNTSRDNSSISGTLVQAMLECHYVVHRAFLSENQLLRPDNINALRQHNIPAIAVHGQMDYVCPVGIAYALHQAWPEMELRIVAGAGHSMYDRGILPELVEATDKMRSVVT